MKLELARIAGALALGCIFWVGVTVLWEEDQLMWFFGIYGICVFVHEFLELSHKFISWATSAKEEAETRSEIRAAAEVVTNAQPSLATLIALNDAADDVLERRRKMQAFSDELVDVGEKREVEDG